MTQVQSIALRNELQDQEKLVDDCKCLGKDVCTRSDKTIVPAIGCYDALSWFVGRLEEGSGGLAHDSGSARGR